MLNKWVLFQKTKQKNQKNPNQPKKAHKNKLTEKTQQDKKPHTIIIYHLAAGIYFYEIFLEISKWESDYLLLILIQRRIKFLLSKPEKKFRRDLRRLNSLQITFNMYAISDRGFALHTGLHLCQEAISKVFQHYEKFCAN